MKPADLEFLIQLVGEHTGIHLEASKSYLLISRLRPLVRSQGLSSFEDLCDALRGPGKRLLLPEIVDAMTTNETSFFRDRAPFEHLMEHVLPELIEARAKTRKLRLWSAASSSGQEAVSLAILLREHFPELQSWDVKILASDISPAMVKRCRAARFSESEMGRGMSLELRSRYFEPVEDDWQASSSIRAMLDVRQKNLIEPMVGVERQDLVVLRNVLIYFREELQHKIFRSIFPVLAPDGYLLLGTAEKPGCEKYKRAAWPQANVFRKAS